MKSYFINKISLIKNLNFSLKWWSRVLATFRLIVIKTDFFTKKI